MDIESFKNLLQSLTQFEKVNLLILDFNYSKIDTNCVIFIPLEKFEKLRIVSLNASLEVETIKT